jgi:hypothetical protein
MARFTSNQVLKLLRGGTPDERKEFLQQLPPTSLKDAVVGLIGSDNPAMVLVALGSLILQYCNGTDPEVGAVLATAAHQRGIELWETKQNRGLLLTTLSGFAVAHLKALELLGLSEEQLEAAADYIRRYETLGESENLPSLKVARIWALVNLRRFDEANIALQNVELLRHPIAGNEANRLKQWVVQYQQDPTKLKLEEESDPETWGRGAKYSETLEVGNAVAPQDEDFDDLLGLDLVGRTNEFEEVLTNKDSSSIEGIDVALSADASAVTSDDGPLRSAYALLDCPDEVEPMIEFVVSVGLAEHPMLGVISTPFVVPRGNYKLTVTLTFDGFLLKSGEVNQVTLNVTADEQYPTKDLHFTAVVGDKFKSTRTLLAVYSVEGQYIGSASRAIVVKDKTESPSLTLRRKGFDLSMPPGVPTPDMTISIMKGNTVSGDRLLWNVLSPHKKILTKLPEDQADYQSDIGSTPEKWARDLMNSVNGYPADKDLGLMMIGNGREIRWQIPVWVRQKLRELSALFADPKKPRPSVFIVSDEPHIPWELAYLKLYLPGRSEDFLGSAFAVGRWVHGTEDVDGNRVPPYPPPTEVVVGNMAVVSGHYDTKYWKALEGAEQEAGELVASYHAVPVNADGQLATWLSQQAAADAIHFAVHGKWSAGGGQDGIILVDGTTLTSKEIRGIKFTKKPFVFLNACQLGQGEKILGDYGGIAKAFLDAGAAGVVAALWNVNDKEAKNLALGFYEKAKLEHVYPAEIFRKLRSSFQEGVHSKLALAYQYFGHPQMRMMLNLS